MFEKLFASMQGAYSANTIRAYKSDIRHYLDWFKQQDSASEPFTPPLLARYVGQMAERYKSATIRRRLRSLSSVLLLSEQVKELAGGFAAGLFEVVDDQCGDDAAYAAAVDAEDGFHVLPGTLPPCLVRQA